MSLELLIRGIIFTAGFVFLSFIIGYELEKRHLKKKSSNPKSNSFLLMSGIIIPIIGFIFLGPLLVILFACLGGALVAKSNEIPKLFKSKK